MIHTCSALPWAGYRSVVMLATCASVSPKSVELDPQRTRETSLDCTHPAAPCPPQFEDVSQAEDALKDTNQLSWHGRTLNVEYVANKADGGCVLAQFIRCHYARSCNFPASHVHCILVWQWEPHHVHHRVEQ